MKKSERLNQMLRYINQKQHFTLKDLMGKFHISKRTALRDITALEEIGAPIYAEYGRYGGYRLLNQFQLPPISFNRQEVYALYFAMQALQSFSDFPFKVTFRSINEKFLQAVSEKQRDEIESMQYKISFRHTDQVADSLYLEILLTAAIKNVVLIISYRKDAKTLTRKIQPISVYAMKGFWYCQAYDLDKQAYRVFRCDRVTSVEETEIPPSRFLNDVTMHSAHSLWKPSEKAIHFKCLVDQRGAELFHQEYYPSMELIKDEEDIYIVGTYEIRELEFITKYLSSFGKSIKIIKPTTLKESLRQYYIELLERI